MARRAARLGGVPGLGHVHEEAPAAPDKIAFFGKPSASRKIRNRGKRKFAAQRFYVLACIFVTANRVAHGEGFG